MKRFFITSLLSFSFSVFAHVPKIEKVYIPQKHQKSVDDYINQYKSSWLIQDLKLLYPTPNTSPNDGWKLRQDKVKNGLPLAIFQRPDPYGNKNLLFYYWNDVSVDLPLEVAAATFTSWFDLAKNWTKESAGGKKLYTTNSGDAVWYQLFVPHMVGVSPRQLVSTCVRKDVYLTNLEGDMDKSILISCRSLPKEVTHLKNARAYSIGWHAAYLFTADRQGSIERTRIRKLDREDQGGWFPAFLMNCMMPQFLNEEVLKAVAFVQKNRVELIERF